MIFGIFLTSIYYLRMLEDIFAKKENIFVVPRWVTKWRKYHKIGNFQKILIRQQHNSRNRCILDQTSDFQQPNSTFPIRYDPKEPTKVDKHEGLWGLCDWQPQQGAGILCKI